MRQDDYCIGTALHREDAASPLGAFQLCTWNRSSRLATKPERRAEKREGEVISKSTQLPCRCNATIADYAGYSAVMPARDDAKPLLIGPQEGMKSYGCPKHHPEPTISTPFHPPARRSPTLNTNSIFLPPFMLSSTGAYPELSKTKITYANNANSTTNQLA